MAEFYGRLQGNRGEATRMGSKDSGINVTAETWTNVIRVRQFLTGYSERHLAQITVEGKYGGTAMSITLNADELVRRASEPEVQDALDTIRAAFDGLDAILTPQDVID